VSEWTGSVRREEAGNQKGQEGGERGDKEINDHDGGDGDFDNETKKATYSLV
jgi:hypothetical protein